MLHQVLISQNTQHLVCGMNNHAANTWYARTSSLHSFCLGEQCPDGKVEVSYRYTEHLVALEACWPQQPYSPPQSCSKITTPLKLDQWELAPRKLPDQPLREYIPHGISHGFRVGFDYCNHTTLSVKHNMPSAQANPDPVEKFLATEVSEGRVIGSLRMENFPHVTTGKPLSDKCKRFLNIFIQVCQLLGLPLAVEKIEGPATCVVFLGIVLDAI